MLIPFTLNPPANSISDFEFRRNALFPTPIRLRIASGKSQLMELGAVGQHLPDFFFAGAAGLKDYVAAIGRPRREIVASAIVGELNPLFAGDIHQINIGGAGFSGAIFPGPCKSQKLSVGRPVGRDGIALVRHTLLVGAVSLHGINLRQPSAAAYEGDLGGGLAIPGGRNIWPAASRHRIEIPAGAIAHINFRMTGARRRERQARAVGRPRRRKIGAAEMREADQAVEIDRVHEDLPAGFGQGTERKTGTIGRNSRRERYRKLMSYLA